jgi:glycosyltransferase involved in cell wall biosynthesis
VALIGGWNQPAFLRAAAYARRRGVPLAVWVESTARDRRPARGSLEPLKRWIVANADAAVVPGTAAAEYVERLGASRITVAPNAVDLERFERSVARERGRRDELRRRLGVDGCVCLCVSRLSREKGVDTLVSAAAGAPVELVVAGGGPLEAELRRAAPSNVRLLGRVRRDELPALYAAADAFALASRSETWGMAVSEAAAAGLPLVVSETVGAGWDLVEPGVNGFRVPVDDTVRLRESLAALADDDAFRARAGARSRELVAGATPEAWAAAVAGLARQLTGGATRGGAGTSRATR